MTTVAGYDADSFSAFLSALGTQSAPPPTVNDLLQLAAATGEASEGLQTATAASDDAAGKRQVVAMVGLFAAAAALFWVWKR